MNELNYAIEILSCGWPFLEVSNAIETDWISHRFNLSLKKTKKNKKIAKVRNERDFVVLFKTYWDAIEGGR